MLQNYHYFYWITIIYKNKRKLSFDEQYSIVIDGIIKFCNECKYVLNQENINQLKNYLKKN